ncbi:Olfactory receptor 6S1 [Sciurus carolinensis]|uniref:Olfactory receptor 6S1 n=1 Tax=Sciurus carolinensis TaxID=30640 RepID=A0AA41N4X6_SCICA|nr:Olfactory receptor 6S1 [Sciurus carolinensis]
MDGRNRTRVTEFILHGFQNEKPVDILLFSAFLLMYLISLVGNTLIILLVCWDHRLHSPMYFFVANLAFLEVAITSTVVPEMLASTFSLTRAISFVGCLTQSFVYFLLGSTEFFLLAVTSLDRYVAICNPLRYALIMNRRTAPLLKLVCADTSPAELADFVSSAVLLLGSLLLTGVSYTCIITTVLRMPSAQGRRKAFSTCASHITVVTLYYGSSIFIYVRPRKGGVMAVNKFATVLNTIVTPMLNPFIYSLRNEKVKGRSPSNLFLAFRSPPVASLHFPESFLGARSPSVRSLLPTEGKLAFSPVRSLEVTVLFRDTVMSKTPKYN